ncbi:thiamine pyrophosphate-binding protein [Bauldia sp.]|uniref:thiamine pyrophosphate-binding protein n=1 Tax=Bauldia sp. TaxID=2575872 RepID=UPI003BAB1C93
MRVYEAIVAGLEAVGVDAAFGGAGENAAGLMLALDDSKKIRPVIAKNEQGAAFMACGYAMFSNKLGVCFATAGPGAFNLISGVCVALTDSYPLLAITGYSTMEWTGRGGLNETSGLNRTPDSQKVFDAMTKANFLIKDIDEVADTLQQAIDIAFDGRHGPVHIAVAEDITDPSIKIEDFEPPVLNVRPVVPDPDRVADTAAFLIDAVRDGKKVVLLVGFGAILARANREVLDFIERYQIPLITTLDGKGIVDESHPLAIGVFADSGHKSAWELFLDSDVVVGLGNSFAQHATFDFRDDLFENRKLVHIDVDANQIDKVYKADRAIIGDARLAISGLADAMSVLGRIPPKTYRAPDFDEQRVIKFTPKLHPGQLSQAISKMLPPRGVVLADAGAHLAWLGYYLELKDGQNFRKPGTYGPMGIGVCGAIGVKYQDMDRPVVAAVGDGSYLMSGFELMTAVEHNIPVVWVIFNDGEFKLIKLYQLSAFLKTGLVEFPNPDYVAYARACGADGYSVDRIGDFEDAFQAALDSGRPTLIDARITRLALPNYSPNPEGVLAGVFERISSRFRGGD